MVTDKPGRKSGLSDYVTWRKLNHWSRLIRFRDLYQSRDHSCDCGTIRDVWDCPWTTSAQNWGYVSIKL